MAFESKHTWLEGKIVREQLYISDEVFVTGTEVIVLREIDYRKIGSGKTGPVCSKLQKAFNDIIHRKNRTYKSWLDYVYCSTGE